MTRFYLSVFYLLFFIGILHNRHFFSDTNPDHFIWLAQIFNFFEPFQVVILMIFLFLLGLFLCLFLIWRPNCYIGFLVALTYTLLLSLKFSYGKISHSEHIWIISGFLFCGLSLKKGLLEGRNKFLVRLVQCLFLSHYFSAGLWKLRSILALDHLSQVNNILLDHLAYTTAEGSLKLKLIKQFIIIDHPSFLMVGLIFVLCFQLSALVPVFSGRFFAFFGTLAIIFHLSTGLIMGVWFTPTIWGAAFFLVFTELLIKNENIVLKKSH